MSPRPTNPHYTSYHPKWHRVRMPIFWWARKWAHARFILRELTSVFVASYAILILLQVRALLEGPEEYAAFQAKLQNPFAILFHIIAIIFVVFHSVSWFRLAPKALVLRIGRKRIPDGVITALNYGAWGAFSIAIAWIMLAA